ncbi:hypothetical protein [Streptomyces lavendofoliae]|uniref:Uncharacterized protein n=1 Tax=Streptomyces lavendofoliae TaxID=67314 RepID=A0A918I345_9ACTN|nr:hypothetical protein [Streptomyces lavendofoliae]GGU62382.1 hypothetical protein GCM10010274_58950 [Streptomyces lavendofoliae]
MSTLEDAQAAADVARAVVDRELERLRTELARARNRVTALHAPVQHMGQTWCSECSVRRSTGPTTDEWVALIPHPCPTIDAFSEQAPDTVITDGH